MNFKIELRLDSTGYYVVIENKITQYDGGLFSLDHYGMLAHNYLKSFKYISGVDEL